MTIRWKVRAAAALSLRAAQAADGRQAVVLRPQLVDNQLIEPCDGIPHLLHVAVQRSVVPQGLGAQPHRAVCEDSLPANVGEQARPLFFESVEWQLSRITDFVLSPAVERIIPVSPPRVVFVALVAEKNRLSYRPGRWPCRDVTFSDWRKTPGSRRSVREHSNRHVPHNPECGLLCTVQQRINVVGLPAQLRKEAAQVALVNLSGKIVVVCFTGHGCEVLEMVEKLKKGAVPHEKSDAFTYEEFKCRDRPDTRFQEPLPRRRTC